MCFKLQTNWYISISQLACHRHWNSSAVYKYMFEIKILVEETSFLTLETAADKTAVVQDPISSIISHGPGNLNTVWVAISYFVPLRAMTWLFLNVFSMYLPQFKLKQYSDSFISWWLEH